MTIYTRVGKFHVSNGFGKVLCRGSTYSYYNIKLFILVIIIVSSILLIMAGNVELTPIVWRVEGVSGMCKY